MAYMGRLELFFFPVKLEPDPHVSTEAFGWQMLEERMNWTEASVRYVSGWWQ